MAYSKVVFHDVALMDITDSTVTKYDLRDGIIAYDSAGKQVVGDYTSNVTVTNFSGTVSLISGSDYRLNITS